MVEPDPKVRKDGKCACGCGQKLPRSKRAMKYSKGQLERDPFATSWCCRQWYRVSIRGDEEPEHLRRVRSESGQKARANYDAVKAFC